MIAKNDSHTALATMLRLTKDKELDCDSFREWMAPYVDDLVKHEHTRALIEHHLAMCSECAEELELLQRALDRGAYPK